MRNHIKLEIRLFVMNFNSRGFSLRVQYCLVNNGYGNEDCRFELTKGKINKWLKHKLRATLKVSYFQNEFMKTKLLPKNERKIARNSALRVRAEIP